MKLLEFFSLFFSLVALPFIPALRVLWGRQDAEPLRLVPATPPRAQALQLQATAETPLREAWQARLSAADAAGLSLGAEASRARRVSARGQTVRVPAGEVWDQDVVAGGPVNIEAGATVRGSIQSDTRVDVGPGAAVLGDVVAPNVFCARGAWISGSCLAKNTLTVSEGAMFGSRESITVAAAAIVALGPFGVNGVLRGAFAQGAHYALALHNAPALLERTLS